MRIIILQLVFSLICIEIFVLNNFLLKYCLNSSTIQFSYIIVHISVKPIRFPKKLDSKGSIKCAGNNGTLSWFKSHSQLKVLWTQFLDLAEIRVIFCHDPKIYISNFTVKGSIELFDLGDHSWTIFFSKRVWKLLLKIRLPWDWNQQPLD